jgi:hypothetical protein
MSLASKITALLIAEGHDEPVGQIDRMNGVGVESKDGAK